MTLPINGTISLDMIRNEIRKKGMITLNDPECRLLADKDAGIIKLSDFYGKQYWYRICIRRSDTKEILSDEEAIKKTSYDFSKFEEMETEDEKFVFDLIDDETKTKIDFSNLSITKDYNITATMIDAFYDVVFNTNGGKPLVQTQKVHYGDKATIPNPEPSKIGYTFINWIKNGETLPYNFDNPVTESFTLNATYEEKYFTVSFESNGGSTISSKRIQEGNTVEVPINPTKNGHTFMGWFSDINLTNQFDFSSPIMNNLTLYAKWKINTYIIKFIPNTTESIYDDITLEYNSLIPIPSPEPIKEGYDFDGWYIDDNFNVKMDFNTYRVSSNVTLYGKWNIKVFNVWFYPNDGKAENNENGYIKYRVNYGDTTPKPSNPIHKENDKYEFVFWSETDPSINPTEFDFSTKIKKNYLIQAYFKTRVFTVKYYVNDTLYWSITRKYGEFAVIKDVELPEGATSFYWTYDRVNKYDFDTPITGDLNLYALFHMEILSVNFNTNGGSPESIQVQYVEYGKLASKPQDPTLVNNQFLGWFENDTTETPFDFNMPIKKSYILKARWKKLLVILKFIAEDSKEILINKTIAPNTRYTISIWNTAKDGEYIAVNSKGGPVGFKIDDGELGADGVHKEYFDRVITDDTTIEVEMMRFDHYFNDYKDLSDQIAGGFKYNLQDRRLKIGFSDDNLELNDIVLSTSQGNLFKYFPILYSRSCKTLYRTFFYFAQIKEMVFDFFYYIPFVNTFESLFSNSLVETLSFIVCKKIFEPLKGDDPIDLDMVFYYFYGGIKIEDKNFLEPIKNRVRSVETILGRLQNLTSESQPLGFLTDLPNVEIISTPIHSYDYKTPIDAKEFNAMFTNKPKLRYFSGPSIRQVEVINGTLFEEGTFKNSDNIEYLDLGLWELKTEITFSDNLLSNLTKLIKVQFGVFSRYVNLSNNLFKHLQGKKLIVSDMFYYSFGLRGNIPNIFDGIDLVSINGLFNDCQVSTNFPKLYLKYKDLPISRTHGAFSFRTVPSDMDESAIPEHWLTPNNSSTCVKFGSVTKEPHISDKFIHNYTHITLETVMDKSEFKSVSKPNYTFVGYGITKFYDNFFSIVEEPWTLGPSVIDDSIALFMKAHDRSIGYVSYYYDFKIRNYIRFLGIMYAIIWDGDNPIYMITINNLYLENGKVYLSINSSSKTNPTTPNITKIILNDREIGVKMLSSKLLELSITWDEITNILPNEYNDNISYISRIVYEIFY